MQTGRCLCAVLREVEKEKQSRLSATSLYPVFCSTPPANAFDNHVHCTMIALSGNVVAEVFVFKGKKHGSMPYLSVVGVVAGTLPIFTSQTRTLSCSRSLGSASWFRRMDLTWFSNSLPPKQLPPHYQHFFDSHCGPASQSFVRFHLMIDSAWEDMSDGGHRIFCLLPDPWSTQCGMTGVATAKSQLLVTFVEFAPL